MAPKQAARSGQKAGAPARRAGAPKKKRDGRIQRIMNRLLTRFGWVRRRYVRTVLKSIAKSKKKGRVLSPEMEQLDRSLLKVPPAKRAEMVEQMILLQNEPDSTSREMRRAMERQNRQRSSGKGQRPGTLGGSRVTERR